MMLFFLFSLKMLLENWLTELMNFGFRSTSKVASRKREMLSKRNRKGQEPSLCRTMEMLLRLLDRSLVLAYFSSFCASSLWLMSYFSSRFILVLRLHSHRLRQCLPKSWGSSSQYFSALSRYILAEAYSDQQYFMYPIAASQQAVPSPQPSWANSALAVRKKVLDSASLLLVRRVQALIRSRLAETRYLFFFWAVMMPQLRQVSMEVFLAFLTTKRMVMQQITMRSTASFFWTVFSSWMLLTFLFFQQQARIWALEKVRMSMSFSYSSSHPQNSTLKIFSQNFFRGYLSPMKLSSLSRTVLQLSSSNRNISCALWLYCESVPTCSQIFLIFLASSSQIRSWYLIFSSCDISFSTSTMMWGCRRQYLQPPFSMHCTSEWFISFLAVSFHFPPCWKILPIHSESRPFGSRLRIFTISAASLHLWFMTLREILMAVETTLLMLSLGLQSSEMSLCISRPMVGFSSIQYSYLRLRQASREAVMQMASGCPSRKLKKAASSSEKSSSSCLLMFLSILLKNSDLAWECVSLSSSQSTSEQQSICRPMECRLVKTKTRSLQVFIRFQVSFLKVSRSSEAMMFWQLSKITSKFLLPSSLTRRRMFSAGDLSSLSCGFSKSSIQSTSYILPMFSQRLSYRQTMPSLKWFLNWRQRTSSRTMVLLPMPDCPVMVMNRRFWAIRLRIQYMSRQRGMQCSTRLSMQRLQEGWGLRSLKASISLRCQKQCSHFSGQWSFRIMNFSHSCLVNLPFKDNCFFAKQKDSQMVVFEFMQVRQNSFTNYWQASSRIWYQSRMQITCEAPASANTFPADSEWQLATNTSFRELTPSCRSSVSPATVTLTDSPLSFSKSRQLPFFWASQTPCPLKWRISRPCLIQQCSFSTVAGAQMQSTLHLPSFRVFWMICSSSKQSICSSISRPLLLIRGWLYMNRKEEGTGLHLPLLLSSLARFRNWFIRWQSGSSEFWLKDRMLIVMLLLIDEPIRLSDWSINFDFSSSSTSLQLISWIVFWSSGCRSRSRLMFSMMLQHLEFSRSDPQSLVRSIKGDEFASPFRFVLAFTPGLADYSRSCSSLKKSRTGSSVVLRHLWARDTFLGLSSRLGSISFINYLNTLSSVLAEDTLSFSLSFYRSIMIRFYRFYSVKMLSCCIHVLYFIRLRLLKSSFISQRLSVKKGSLSSPCGSKRSRGSASGVTGAVTVGGESAKCLSMDSSVSLLALPSSMTRRVWPVADLSLSYLPLPMRHISFLMKSQSSSIQQQQIGNWFESGE